MARKIRIEYAGAIYHVMNRGDRQEAIFEDDDDRRRFMDTLAEACLKTGWQVHAYCLMGNHFHLVVETPQANLVAGMKWFLGTYTSRFNRRHKRVGHLFSGRYKALIVDGSGSGYLRTVCDYVHLNLARSKLLTPGQPLRDYGWSSHGEYLKAPGKRVAWLRVDRLFGELGIPTDSPAGRRRFEEMLEQRRTEELADEWKPIRRGWCLGDEQFRKELLEQVHARAGDQHYGEEIRESVEEKAQRVIAEELKRLRWAESDLAGRRKGDTGKARIARRLRRETTVSKRWIAERLAMGSVSNVTLCLRAATRR